MIYTRMGDEGATSLLNGARVPKNCLRVECYGTVDELNSLLGFAKNFLDDTVMRNRLHTVQQELFAVAAELADPGGEDFQPVIAQKHIAKLEEWIDEYVEKVNPAPHFIVPGSNKASGVLHMGRTVCRRGERLLVSLSQQEAVSPYIMKYINRLSDALYMFARCIEAEEELVSAAEIG
jgi:cob(I)alamin adenosyltransferase